MRQESFCITVPHNSKKYSDAEKRKKCPIKWKQEKLCIAVSNNPKMYPELAGIFSRFKGLCDVICNLVVIRDLLKEDTNFNEINLERLNSQIVAGSHFINRWVKKYGAFGFFEKWRHLQNENHTLIPESLFEDDNAEAQSTQTWEQRIIQLDSKMKKEEYVKILLYRSKFTFTEFPDGHTILVKKTNRNEFAIFDPNDGAYFDLNSEELIEKIKNLQLCLKRRFNFRLFTCGYEFEQYYDKLFFFKTGSTLGYYDSDYDKKPLHP